ncbi:MAG: NADH-quinone oxidoreductase subunit NuoK [Candidatus Thorarchaeota archaeon]
MIPLTWYLVFSFMLIGLGAYGMSVKRNLIRILIGAEIMGNGVNIALVAFSLYYPGVFTITGQALIVLVISVTAAHTALAMVLMLMYHRRYHTVDLGRSVSAEVPTSE